MTKRLEITSDDDIEHWLSVLRKTSSAAQQSLKEVLSYNDSPASLAAMKFRQVGFDPFDSDRKLNIIEQLNQWFTYWASLKAAGFLLVEFPSAVPLILNLGTRAGSDIESDRCGGIAAEVFATVAPKNNRKLDKDIEKVAKVDADHKFVFFLCPDIAEGNFQNDSSHPDVKVFSLGFDW